MILSQSPELEVKPSGMLWGESTSDSLALPELDEPTAHTLVHYLYSGRYQTLDSFSDTSDKAGTVSAYRLGTCVYCAAMRYQLPGLAELAKERITTIAEELTILDILGVAREHAFPNLPQAESWYPSYLEGAIKAAVTEDPELFMKPEFVDQIEGDRRFRQVVMSAVVNSYSKGMSGLSDRTAGVSTPMTDAKAEPLDTSVVTEPERQLLKDAIQDPQEQTSPKTTEAVGPPASNDRVPEPDQQLAGGPKGETAAEPFLEKDELELDEIEPSAPAPPKPEPFTDELGFASSKTYQKMGQKDANPGNSRLALDTESAAPMHKRVDSAIQAPENGAIESASSEHAITTPSEIAKLDASNAPIAAEVSANGASVTPKKVKKKKKKTAAAKE
jgi:hypothetical protein